MAHALYGHDGPCRNIHGHTYHLEVTIRGEALRESGDARDGMVMDFAELKWLVQREIIQHFDHALVLNKNSPHAALAENPYCSGKLVLVPYQPTCENLLADFKCRLEHHFNAHLQLVSMRLCETPSSYAEWKKEDN